VNKDFQSNWQSPHLLLRHWYSCYYY